MISEADLRCPLTGRPLRARDGAMWTDDGEIRYPIVGGIPILVAEGRSLFGPETVDTVYSFTAAHTTCRRRLVRAVAKALPDDSRNYGAEEYVDRLLELLAARMQRGGPRPRVLIIGGAVAGAGVASLLTSEHVDLTETDVYIGPRTRIVCDGHDLPFRDGAFDAVVCQAVLEHVVDPQRVVMEIHRVLAPEGLVYSEVPFMQQVHAGAYDFTRFTHLRHRRLYRRFDEIASGAVCGPAMALAWSIRYFAAALAGDSTLLGRLAYRLVPLLTFWMPRLDRWLVTTPGGLDAASGTAFLGRRREDPVPDAEIVAGYRGLNSRS